LWFALFAEPAEADVLGEWTYSQSCPAGSVEVIDDTIILRGPDGGGCQGANWVKIETTIPADVDTIDFTWAYQTNDGWNYDPPQYGINGVYTLITQQNNATGELSVPVQEGDVFTFRQYSTDSCCQPGNLTISNLSLWASITSSTTTTTSSTTTVPETTVPVTNPTTTTVQETTTTVPETTTSVENSTSTTSSTTSTSSVPQTTTTESTTTTTQPPPPPAPTPPQTVPPVSVETSVPTTLPETTTSTTSTTVTATTTTAPPPSSTTTTTSTSSIPPATTIAPESPQTTLPAVLSDLTPTEALSVALTPETLTASQAEQVFASIQTDQLTDTQVAELTAAVQNAPTEVREAFEDKVDVFKAGFDDYVPLGSNIPVGERRTLIAVTAGITLAAAGTRIRR
jgi:hypothetical protein